MKLFYRILIAVLVLVLFITLFYNIPRLKLISGYAAKNISSSIHITNRPYDSILAFDNNIPNIKLASYTKAQDSLEISASVFGLQGQSAMYRTGVGSVLVQGSITEATLAKPGRIKTAIAKPYPFGNLEAIDTTFASIDYNALKNHVENFFYKSGIKQETRGVVVLHKDHLIYEKYAPGFDKNTPQLGWSMTKSLTATWYAVLAKKNGFDIKQKVLLENWEKDERKNISYHNLLQMNSGLDWNEDYTAISDVTRMLFEDRDTGKRQGEKKLSGKINASWNYSSGTTNLLSKLLRKQFATHQDYLDFVYKDLIDKIGMHSMLVETDMNGTYIGSSYGWATPRDWGKLGLLYLKNGEWNGEQIFDKNWVNYATTPTPESNENYGAQLWLNKGGYLPNSPRDAYSFNGYQGQRVVIIPSKDIVIVRMGLAPIDYDAFISGIVACF